MGDPGRIQRIITPRHTYGQKVRSSNQAQTHTSANSASERAA
jgi:hypothetical protein